MNEKQMEWMDGIYPYLRLLIRINKNYLKLMDIKKGKKINEEVEDVFFDISTDLLRLLPYSIDKNLVNVRLLNDGIVLLKKYFKFIKRDYNNILISNTETLKNIIKVRNKFIHESHNITWITYLQGKNSCCIEFRYKDSFYEIDTTSLKLIILELNDIFIKIQQQFKEEIKKLDTGMKDHPYIKNVINVDINDYKNKITGGI